MVCHKGQTLNYGAQLHNKSLFYDILITFQDIRLMDSTNSIAMLSRDFDSFFVLEASGKCIIGTLTLF